jgi:hypothetical protein
LSGALTSPKIEKGLTTYLPEASSFRMQIKVRRLVGSMAAALEEDHTGAYVGWIAGLLIILAVLGAGAFLWFHYHP